MNIIKGIKSVPTIVVILACIAAQLFSVECLKEAGRAEQRALGAEDMISISPYIPGLISFGLTANVFIAASAYFLGRRGAAK